MTDHELPDIGKVIAPILQRVPPERRPLLIALAERLAAERYRGWASACTDAARKAALLECARREEEIAHRVEALDGESTRIQREILAAHPDLEAINRTLFANRPLREQLAIQANGERLGAATWRAFASREPDPGVRETLLGCALLEEESAAFLEAILRTVE